MLAALWPHVEHHGRDNWGPSAPSTPRPPGAATSHQAAPIPPTAQGSLFCPCSCTSSFYLGSPCGLSPPAPYSRSVSLSFSKHQRSLLKVLVGPTVGSGPQGHQDPELHILPPLHAKPFHLESTDADRGADRASFTRPLSWTPRPPGAQGGMRDPRLVNPKERCCRRRCPLSPPWSSLSCLAEPARNAEQ